MTKIRRAFTMINCVYFPMPTVPICGRDHTSGDYVKTERAMYLWLHLCTWHDDGVSCAECEFCMALDDDWPRKALVSSKIDLMLFYGPSLAKTPKRGPVMPTQIINY
eukprot:GEMP01046218.1.p1 GENE.GEMP01046218.1~~GEMP01046218.1.p1  ORF type:complete len:107 (+),score=3.89 GEMP01046218.1:73-393(+)